MKSINEQLVEYRRKYQNKWVALDKTTSAVLYSNKNLKNLVKKADVKSRDYVLEKVLPINAAFIPYSPHTICK